MGRTAKSFRYLFDGLLFLIGAFCLLSLLRILLTLQLAVPLDPNEGWNAYWSNAAIKGEALYPAASAYLVNNYPPLSFYAVGAVGRLLGDNIFAGRLISLVAFASTLGAVWLAARRMGCGNHGAIFAALSLSAYLLAFTDYVGMNDPQLIGNALGTWGMVILLREPRRQGSIFLDRGAFEPSVLCEAQPHRAAAGPCSMAGTL